MDYGEVLLGVRLGSVFIDLVNFLSNRDHEIGDLLDVIRVDVVLKRVRDLRIVGLEIR